MVVQKESGSYVKRNEDIDGIVFVSGQNEKDSKHIEQPGYCVQKVQMTWCIWNKKNVVDNFALEFFGNQNLHSVMKKFKVVRATVCPLNI